ncbi:MAG: shikimate kinase [Terriglobales bacterium]
MRPKRPPRAVFLVGFMGAGKSRVGRALARLLGWRFVDLDRRVEAREGRSIAQIFRGSREAAFRQAETAELKGLLGELMGSPGTVVALGGGVPAQAANRKLLRGAQTVFVDVPAGALWERCRAGRGKRPLVRDEASFRRLYDARRPHYAAATVRVRAGERSPTELAAEIARRLGFSIGRGNRTQEKP